MEGSDRLLEAVLAGPDAIYDQGYATVARCEVCGRAVAEADCERDEELPPAYRMCFRVVDGQDPTCQPGVR